MNKSEYFLMVKGDTVIFSEDFEYLTKGVAYSVDNVDKVYVYFKDPKTGSGTFSNRHVLLRRKQNNPDLYRIEPKTE